jgi:hypothetical protein
MCSSVAGGLISKVTVRLAVAIRMKQVSELKKFKQEVVEMCDTSLHLLEERSQKLFKSYTQLKLECTQHP